MRKHKIQTDRIRDWNFVSSLISEPHWWKLRSTTKTKINGQRLFYISPVIKIKNQRIGKNPHFFIIHCGRVFFVYSIFVQIQKEVESNNILLYLSPFYLHQKKIYIIYYKESLTGISSIFETKRMLKSFSIALKKGKGYDDTFTFILYYYTRLDLPSPG